jgi:hypothetical protein
MSWLPRILGVGRIPGVNQDGTLEIQVTDTGGRSITFGSGPAKATVTSDAPAFVRWVTQRATWADLDVQAAGDEQALAVARSLKVY